MDKVRVLVADDHRLFREGLLALFATQPELEVAGEAGSGEEAVSQALTLLPDVVLMDIQMPGMSGIEATRRIVHAQPRLGVIMLTMLEDDDSVFAAMRAGARGYILKGADKSEVMRTLLAVARGEALFGPGIARRLMQFFGALGATPAPPLAFPELTEREREILDLIAQGLANPEIAQRLSLSPKTVGNHITNIFDKLQVADRAKAILRARDAGLGAGR